MLTRFGNPVLRQICPILTIAEIKDDRTQRFVDELKTEIHSKKYGVGLAAPQLGKSMRMAVIDIKPTELRPDVVPFSLTLINPTYQGIGRRASLWEGCLSSGAGKNTLYGKALRYMKIRATWQDERGVRYDEELSGLPAHVFQHETDHLDGILFVDRVRDSKTYMLADEYRKRIAKKGHKKPIR